MSRSYEISKYEPLIAGNGTGLTAYRLDIRYINEGRESVEHKLVDGGNIIRFISRGFFEDHEGTAFYVSQSDRYNLDVGFTGVLATFQDFVCAHMTNNWNCSMQDLEIYYNLYLSYKGIITKSELFKIIDKILEG